MTIETEIWNENGLIIKRVSSNNRKSILRYKLIYKSEKQEYSSKKELNSLETAIKNITGEKKAEKIFSVINMDKIGFRKQTKKLKEMGI